MSTWPRLGLALPGRLQRLGAVAPRPAVRLGRSAGRRWGWWIAGLGVLVLVMGGLAPAHSQNRVVLPSATDLPQALAQALAQGQPLVVMVSLDNCPYCRQVRQSHLGPLWRGGQVVVQIDMQHKETLIDWDGQTRSHGDWVKSRRISVAPTVLFFGPKGREVADRLEGASLPDFYGAYLDQRLEQSRQLLQPRAGAHGRAGKSDGPHEGSGLGLDSGLPLGLSQHQPLVFRPGLEPSGVRVNTNGKPPNSRQCRYILAVADI